MKTKNQSIRPTNDLFFQSPASISAFAEAVQDRLDYWNGCASEQHIPEPKRGVPTLPPPPRQARRAAEALPPEPAFLDLGSRWHPFD